MLRLGDIAHELGLGYIVRSTLAIADVSDVADLGRGGRFGRAEQHLFARHQDGFPGEIIDAGHRRKRSARRLQNAGFAR